ncbi:MAG: hypothetical protein WDN45_17275 [Caulobacteraceae bacterium]
MQSTEAKVGPYALQDFNLYYTTRYGFGPAKVAFLAQAAWADASRGAWPPNYPENQRKAFGLAEIKRWMRVFYERFFTTSQYKRSAMPNGPKISSGGSLSPRGDWRAPSDGNASGVAGGARSDAGLTGAARPYAFGGQVRMPLMLFTLPGQASAGIVLVRDLTDRVRGSRP